MIKRVVRKIVRKRLEIFGMKYKTKSSGMQPLCCKYLPYLVEKYHYGIIMELWEEKNPPRRGMDWKKQINGVCW
ncbi:MAG: hypothetical protein D3907_04385 [Candidatus Electrothrix sp. AUS3]|nr:hypothetical protein [Candidatus Electrothrix gigas]